MNTSSTAQPTEDPRFPWREAGLLLVWLLVAIAWRPLLLPDEGRYAGVAYEMALRGSLEPTLDGLPFFHKPPLLYALDIAALKLLGVHAFAARLGPALLGWGLGLSIFLLLRRWHGVAVARTALVVLATAPFFFVGAQYVNHDIGVAACITAALCALARAVDDPARTHRGWLVAGWALCGLGVMAKGLIGVVLPAAVLGPWLLAQGRWRQVLGLLHPAGLLAFVAVAGPWMWAMQQRHADFFDYFIVEQHFRRFTGTTFNNRMPGWFYAAVLPLLTLPWSAWLLRLPRLHQGVPGVPLRPAQVMFYVWWVVAIAGFFSLPASKLVGYVLPALAPLAAVLALVMHATGFARGRGFRVLAGAAGALCLGLVGFLAWKAPGTHRELSSTLKSQFQAGDRVAFVEEYFYDLPFDARLPLHEAPVIVVSDWDDPEVPRHDNWRKELFDATRFAADQGHRTLWTWPRAPALPCTAASGRQLWLVVPSEHLPRVQNAVPGVSEVQAVRGVHLLRAPAAADRSACPAA